MIAVRGMPACDSADRYIRNNAYIGMIYALRI